MRKLTSIIMLAVAFVSQGAVISGKVTDLEGRGLGNVGVSDGINITRTNSDGTYLLESDKTTGYVFVITPEGYSPAISNVNRPKFWTLLTGPEDSDENVNFTLKPEKDSRFAFLALADIQISRRNDDVSSFNRISLPDINATIDSLEKKGYNPFVLTLGDQSWDNYWHSKGYGLPEAMADLEKIDAPVYNVIGNHDHNPRVAGDKHASDTWRKIVGPNYYSFNKGGVHIVILDDIYYLNEDATPGKNGKRDYRNYLEPNQLAWLKKDLSYIESETPVIVALHIPLFNKKGSYYLENGAAIDSAFTGFKDVRVLSGHTHLSYTGRNRQGNIRENNYGAVCGTWWRTELPEYGNNSICRDGTPSGYAVWTSDKGNLKGIYKSIGYNIDYQFRAYDMNRIEEPEKNGILVNVWGWSPEWEIEILEKGKPLAVEQITYKDPLHKISCEEPEVRLGKKNPQKTTPTNHFFKAVAKKATTPIEIRVKDSNGEVYIQKMERPKAVTKDMR